MEYFKWRDSMKIGIDFIDDDHKKLFTIIQDTQAAIGEGDNNKCVQLLTSLIKEARDHFSREEEYLLKVNYPDLENHKNYHKELLIKADTTKRICEGIHSEYYLKHCFDEMADYLKDDILKGDINFKSYLEDEGYLKLGKN